MELVDITQNPNEILEQILEIHGIGVIRDFIKGYNKQQRKKQIRVNNCVDVAYDVYYLMAEEKHDWTRAIEKVAEKRHIKVNTVRNHCNNFNRMAKKDDYFEIGEEMWSINVLDGKDMCSVKYEIARKYKIEPKKAESYYFKYEIDNDKKIKKSFIS